MPGRHAEHCVGHIGGKRTGAGANVPGGHGTQPLADVISPLAVNVCVVSPHHCFSHHGASGGGATGGRGTIGYGGNVGGPIGASGGEEGIENGGDRGRGEVGGGSSGIRDDGGNMGCCDIGGRLDELFRDGGDDGGAIGDDDLQLSTARSASHTAV